MNFRNLNKRLQQAIFNLTKDKVFQERFGHDPVLDDLDSQKIDYNEELLNIFSLLGQKFNYKGKYYNYLTLFDWNFLWCKKSPLISKQNREITLNDLDLFLYVIQNGKNIINEKNVEEASKDYVLKEHYDYGEVIEVLFKMIKLAFKPLQFLPVQIDTEGEKYYDLDWVISLASKVHEVSGFEIEKIITELPIQIVCSFYIEWRRKLGDTNIYKRTSQEILKAQDERSCDLIAERLLELGVIKENEKEEFLKEIKNNKQ